MAGLRAFLCVLLMAVLVQANNSNKMFFSNFMTRASVDPCYDEDRAKKCLPDFVNAAFGQPIEASSVCGQQRVERFCDVGASKQSCDYCHDAELGKRFPASFLTDVHNSNNVTCWRSQPRAAAFALDTKDNVTLTLSLGKKFEITYVSLTFCPNAIRPDSIAIYKVCLF